MIEPDNELQEAIDNEEIEDAPDVEEDLDDDEAEAAFGEGVDAASDAGTEAEYHAELERIDTRLRAAETEKSQDLSKHNATIKNLKKKRNNVLDELELFRQGERPLPLDE